MVRRASRPRGGRTAGVAVVIAAAVLAGTAMPPLGRAQPAPELSRARDLYRAAEAAMKDGRFADAARDYAASYEASNDPALLFKIGRAHERAGACTTALAYYARYLREGQPAEPFVTTTRERIAACGGDPDRLDAGTTPGQMGSATPSRAGSASTDAGPGSASTDAGSGAGSASTDAGSGAGSASTDAGSGSGSATPATIALPTARHKAAWVLTGGAIALASLGGILAYAANSAENDVRDLYIGFAGKTPAFDARTRESYDDLIAQGRRYQHLSWISFGVAGAAAVSAVVLFATGRRPADAERARVTPVVTPTTAGVSVRF